MTSSNQDTPQQPPADDFFALLKIIQTDGNRVGYTLEFDCMRKQDNLRLGPCDIAAMALAACMMAPETSYLEQITRMNTAVSNLVEALDDAGDDTELGFEAMKRFAQQTGLPIYGDA